MGGHGSTLLRSPFTRAFHEENSWLTACSSQIFGFIVAFTLGSHCLLVPPSQWLSTAGNWSQTISDQHRTLLIGNLCWGTGGPKFLRAAQQTKALLPNPLPSSPPFTGIGSTLQSKSSLLPPPALCFLLPLPVLPVLHSFHSINLHVQYCFCICFMENPKGHL